MSEPRDISKEFTEAIRHWATWPQQLRKLCKSCNDEDLKRLMDFSIAFKDSRELKELNISQPGYYEVVREVIEERRHEEITKDAWVVKWTFWMVLVSILIALWAWLFPRSPASDASTSPILRQPANENQPAIPLSHNVSAIPPYATPTQSVAVPGKSQPTVVSGHTNSVAAPVSPKK